MESPLAAYAPDRLGPPGPPEIDLFSRQLLAAMLAFRSGDFAVRMPSDLTGVNGKIADAFNDIAAVSERRARETARVSRAVGKEGKLKQRMTRAGRGRRLGRRSRGDQHADRRPGVADDRSDARGRRRGQGRPRPVDGARSRRPSARRRVPALGEAGQQDDRPALGVHLGGDARRARGRHRRQARRPGAGQGRVGRLEGADRIGQPDGRQPHRAGPQHRRRDDRRRQRRPLQEDHRRRPRRDPAAEGSHQHDGRSAARLRGGSDARGARSRHRRQARRPGGRARRRRHLEGPHRLGQRDGVEPDRAGAQHRRRDDRRRARRPVAQDHRRRQGRDPRAEGHHQHDGRPAQRVRVGSEPRRARSRHRRQARRPRRSARRGRHVEGPHRLGQRDGRQPHRAGPQHRRSDDRGRARRPVAQDHRRREGRDPRAEGHHQHDGRSAERLRLGSDPRRARGRHRRQARRPGGGARRRRHLEEPDRHRQLDGLEPHRPGPQHRRRRDRRSPRRPVAQDHRRREGRDPRAEEHHQHDGGPAERVRLGSEPRRARGRHRRQARRPGRRCPAWPAPGRTSPTTSTRWRRT